MSKRESDALARVRDLVQQLFGGESTFEVAWSVIGSDPVATVRAVRNSVHSLTMRVQSELVVLDIDGSQAIEFDSSDDRDVNELESLVKAFYSGSLEVLVGSADGQYYRLRGPEFDLSMPSSALSRMRSRSREWKRLE